MEIKEITKEVKDLLESYEYDYEKPYRTDSIQSVIDEWYKNKKDLIELFEKHPNYNGRCQIVLDDTYQRGIDFETAKDELYEIIYFLSESTDDRCQVIKKFIHLLIYMCDTETITSYISQDMVDKMKECNEEFANDLHVGSKLSRTLRKILMATPIKDEAYFERLYAKLSDALNPLEIKRYTILSVHPYDYYTMSFGNTWTSCHTIDKADSRDYSDYENGDSYQGCYSSGTESYMLDSVSVVMYTIDKKSNISKPELYDKISRQMLHIGDEFFVQGRLYPQSNDGDNWEYKQMREIAQRVIAECKGIPNYWRNKKGVSNCESVIQSVGTHYRDYYNFSSCNVSFTLNNNYKKIVIGHDPICPNCGRWHNRQENIMCYECTDDIRYCSQCGRAMTNSEYILVNGYTYCCDQCASEAGAVWTVNNGYMWWDDPTVVYDWLYGEYYHDADNTSVNINGHTYITEENAIKDGWVWMENLNQWIKEGKEIKDE